MNADLKLRLTPLYNLDGQENAYLDYLMDELGKEAMLGLEDVSSDDVPVLPDDLLDLRYHFEYIENGEDDSAYMTGDGETFDVHLDKRMPLGMVIDFILHELAHVHSWHRANDKEDHCDEFGKSYALLYRLYLYLYDNFWN